MLKHICIHVRASKLLESTQLRHWWVEDDPFLLLLQVFWGSLHLFKIPVDSMGSLYRMDQHTSSQLKGWTSQNFEKHETITYNISESDQVKGNKWEKKTHPISFMMAAWQMKNLVIFSCGHPPIVWVITHHQTSRHRNVATCFVLQLHLLLSYSWFCLMD